MNSYDSLVHNIVQEYAKWHIIGLEGAPLTDTGPVRVGDPPTATGDTGGNPMVQVRVSETYDLSTKVGKMGVVGIHTPIGSLIDKMWSGLVLQCKKFRFVKCDVAMACASMLPADPLQIGVEAGAIAPQDMFNPILYKAVSNDTMNNFLSFIQNCAATEGTLTAVDKGSVIDVNDFDLNYEKIVDGTQHIGQVNQFEAYYGLLASEGWRKAMPQAGLQMTDLVPLVYQTLNQYGINQFNDASGQNIGNVFQIPIKVGADKTPVVYEHEPVQAIVSTQIRGPSMRMPAIDTVYFDENPTADVVPSGKAYVKSNTGLVPPAYVALLVLPPAKLNQLYYRLKVTWTIEFTGIRPLSDIAAFTALGSIGSESYGTDYDSQSANMSSKTSMVDTDGADIHKIMEGS
ncbi:capsid protein [Chicken smacovirus mg5_1212]|uniref:Capsid protein n=1 Tax=Chicken smacovirus mg5_1212 TaxID=2720962 RepID=A0A6G9W2H0_9VIRU|nr:capsid protein [Chicken smacovirus mg5_1212]QIR82270.1 capsid protein [Chicken smacovirus mg5_1212]